ncbi:hypothetical protein JL720_13987 [Aureococcus anophagefferens]|nr:hypothetical protein JL720_13987 [Aureococcus anophagefferens]
MDQWSLAGRLFGKAYQPLALLKQPVGSLHGNCWIHAHNALDKHQYRKAFRDQSNVKAFKRDVTFLAYLSVLFRPQKRILFDAFRRKWKDMEPGVTARWCAEYTDQLKKEHWTHMDFPAGLNCDNNALEAINMVFKEECTGYQKKTTHANIVKKYGNDAAVVKQRAQPIYEQFAAMISFKLGELHSPLLEPGFDVLKNIAESAHRSLPMMEKNTKYPCGGWSNRKRRSYW